MYIPMLKRHAIIDNGESIINEDEHYMLCDEADIAAAESGTDRELDYDSYEYEFDFICRVLGTTEWRIDLTSEYHQFTGVREPEITDGSSMNAHVIEYVDHLLDARHNRQELSAIERNILSIY